jgi:hypothetical protein
MKQAPVIIASTECKKADGSTIEDWEARELIHALKRDEYMGAADDLLFEFTEEMLGMQTGQGIECLGTLKQLITMYL